MRILPKGLELLAVARGVLRERIAPHIPAEAQSSLRGVEAALALAADMLERELPIGRDDLPVLETARAALRTTLLRQLPKERQYDARLVAKAIAIATNELVNGTALDHEELKAAKALVGETLQPGGAATDGGANLASVYARLCADIRAGQTDPGSPRYGETYAHLWAITRQAVGESNPAYFHRGTAEAAAAAAKDPA